MDTVSREVIRGYFDNVQVQLATVRYSKVPATWGDSLPAPDVSRLYFIREGRGSISVRDRTFFPRPNQLFLLPAGQPLSFHTAADHPFGKYWCHFSATVGDVNLFQLLDVPYCVEVVDVSALERQFERLIALYHHPSLTSALRIKAVLLDILSSFLEGADGVDAGIHVRTTADNDTIHTLLAYINQHLDEKVSVQDLADLVHLHPQYLIGYFKSMLGLSPIAFLTRKRMERARHLLLQSDLSIGQIAARVGMEPYYFSRVFKRQTGFSPRFYRATLEGSTMPGAELTTAQESRDLVTRSANR